MRWETTTTPEVLVRALDQGFFPPGASVLDIGCGSGEIAAWLAERSHPTVGCDFASSAIDRANEQHRHDALRFRTTDAAELWPEPEQFDCLFDRGCLHCLPESAISTYVANAYASLHAGGRFLLLHKLEKERGVLYPEGVIESRLRHAFENDFHIDSLEHIDIMDGVPDKPSSEIPAVALWMIRRGA